MSADVQQAPALPQDKGDTRANRDPLHRRPSFLLHRRHKGEDVKQCRHCRKRNQRFIYQDKHSGGPQVKRRKKESMIPPTKFLLGGNIRDPLNLNSLRDEEVNRRLNAVTPETSPMPTPQWRRGEVEVLLPPNIHDPLNLEGSQSPKVYVATPSLRKNRKKHKKKKQRLSSDSQSKPDQCEGCGEPTTVTFLPPVPSTSQAEAPLNTSGSDCAEENQQPLQSNNPPFSEVAITAPVPEPLNPVVSAPAPSISDDNQSSGKPVIESSQSVPVPPLPPIVAVPPNTLPLSKPLDAALPCKKLKGGNSKKAVDKIVSPVVRQPGACGASGPRRKPQQLPPPKIKPQIMPNFKESNKKYQYGNYNRYYGYRNADYDFDPRLRLLELRRDLFIGKEVLDVGCNTGHITLAVATNFGARRVVGLDLDRKLVEAAKGNIKHYLRRGNTSQSYPVSMPLLYGPLPDSRPDLTPGHASEAFPHNITFVQGNYVLTSDVLVDLETPQFDTILCLSVTKWFHLNWGDEGLKRAFRRMYAQLRPGGSLILEPQPWSSYKKKKNITETTWANYQSIQLFPPKFTQFLLSEVGFTKCEMLGSPAHFSRGFQRPIKIFTKGERSHLLPIQEETNQTLDISSDYKNIEKSHISSSIVETELGKQLTDDSSDNLMKESESNIEDVTCNSQSADMLPTADITQSESTQDITNQLAD